MHQPANSSLQLPAELVYIILAQLWHDPQWQLSLTDRVRAMTAWPSVSRQWRAIYATISSKHIHIPSLSFLSYISRVLRTRRSKIYDHHILSQSCQTIKCLVDSGTSPHSLAALKAYTAIVSLPNYEAFRLCFPNAKLITFASRIFVDNIPPKGRSLGQTLHTQIDVPLSRITTTGTESVSWVLILYETRPPPGVRPQKFRALGTSPLGAVLRAVAPGPFVSAPGEVDWTKIGTWWQPLPYALHDEYAHMAFFQTFPSTGLLRGDLKGINRTLLRSAHLRFGSSVWRQALVSCLSIRNYVGRKRWKVDKSLEEIATQGQPAPPQWPAPSKHRRKLITTGSPLRHKNARRRPNPSRVQLGTDTQPSPPLTVSHEIMEGSILLLLLDMFGLLIITTYTTERITLGREVEISAFIAALACAEIGFKQFNLNWTLSPDTSSALLLFGLFAVGAFLSNVSEETTQRYVALVFALIGVHRYIPKWRFVKSQYLHSEGTCVALFIFGIFCTLSILEYFSHLS